PPALGTERNDIPPELETILSRMLEKDPSQRFQTPAEAARALEGILRTLMSQRAAPDEDTGQLPSLAGEPTGLLAPDATSTYPLSTPRNQASVPAKSAHSSPPMPAGARAPRQSRALPLFLGSVGIAALGGMALFAFLSGKPQPAAQAPAKETAA